MTTEAHEYAELIRAFLEEEISASEFETRYLAKFKSETRKLDSSVFTVLDRLFADVDAFCSDEEEYKELSAEHPGSYLTETELRARAHEAYAQLQR